MIPQSFVKKTIFTLCSLCCLSVIVSGPSWAQQMDDRLHTRLNTKKSAEDTARIAKNVENFVAWDENARSLQALAFASGEILGYDTVEGILEVKVYLDAEGNAVDTNIRVHIVKETQITDGEMVLAPTALHRDAEVDVEYEIESKKATYIFVY